MSVFKSLSRQQLETIATVALNYVFVCQAGREDQIPSEQEIDRATEAYDILRQELRAAGLIRPTNPRQN